MHKALLDILVCPLCKGALVYKAKEKELWCRFDRLAYAIEDEIPVMLSDKARHLSDGELHS